MRHAISFGELTFWGKFQGADSSSNM
jgi:hypothetical protein